MENNESTSALWNNVLKSAISLPFVKVNRNAFLMKELSPYCSEDQICFGIENSPIQVLNKKHIDKIARGCISYHLTIVCGTSALAGLPGGWFMLGTIPADISQFYFHVFALTQKLLYLYGWPDLSNEKGELDDETAQILTLFTGVMMGSQAANNALKELTKAFANETAKRLPRMALTKYGVYNIAKQIAKWIGIKLTRTTFARSVSKVIPLIGAPISAGLTYATFKPMTYKLKQHLNEQYELNIKKIN